MKRLRHSTSATAAAAIAAVALLLQALLLSLTPPVANAAAGIESLSAHALCFGSGARREDPAAPLPAQNHSHHACCILCAVPGLAAGAAPVVFVAPVWISSFAPRAVRGRVIHLAQPFERSPVRPRAPPA